MDHLGNNELEQLSQKIGFDCFIFDRKAEPTIKLKDGSSGTEIDAIISYKNLFCLLEVYGGASEQEATDKIEDFSRGLRDFKNDTGLSRLNITSSGTLTPHTTSIKNNYTAALEKVRGIVPQFDSTILRKIVFCPNAAIDENVLHDYAAKDVYVIDRDSFNYFNAAAVVIDNSYAFRDFAAFLQVHKIHLEGDSTIEPVPRLLSPIQATELAVSAGKISMYTTTIKIKNIIDLVTVLRVSQKYNKKGFQRMVDEKRMKKIITGYLNSNDTFPNNIILGMNPDFYTNPSEFVQPNKVRLYDEYNSLYIIDGQHRFFSLYKKNPNSLVLATFLFFKKDGEDPHVVMDRMFFEINTAQSKIDTRLSFYLKSRINPASDENFWFDVFKKLNKNKGFFKDKISFKESVVRRREGLKKDDLFSVIKYGGTLKLNQSVKKNFAGLNKVYGNLSDKKFAAYKLFRNYFELLSQSSSIPQQPPRNFSAREIGASIRLIRHFIITDEEKVKALMGFIYKKENPLSSYNEDQLKSIRWFKKIFSCIDFDKIESLQLAASNWAAVEGLMLKQIHATNSGFGSTDILSKKGRELYGT